MHCRSSRFGCYDRSFGAAVVKIDSEDELILEVGDEIIAPVVIFVFGFDAGLELEPGVESAMKQMDAAQKLALASQIGLPVGLGLGVADDAGQALRNDQDGGVGAEAEAVKSLEGLGLGICRQFVGTLRGVGSDVAIEAGQMGRESRPADADVGGGIDDVGSLGTDGIPVGPVPGAVSQGVQGIGTDREIEVVGGLDRNLAGRVFTDRCYRRVVPRPSGPRSRSGGR